MYIIKTVNRLRNPAVKKIAPAYPAINRDKLNESPNMKIGTNPVTPPKYDE